MWQRCCSWTGGRNTTADKRIHELLDAAWLGMGKALTAEPDRVMYKFKHWYWIKGKTKAKKATKAKLGARLLLDPETEEPWILIFHPEFDGEEVLKRGEPEEDRGDEPVAGECVGGSEPSVDFEGGLGGQ